MRLQKRMACWIAAVVGCAGPAGAETLGAQFAQLRYAYPQADSVQVEGHRALELRQEDYGGVHWDRVDFVFNAAGRLDHLSMSTASASYETVQRLAMLQLSPPSAASSPAAASDEDLSDDMQIRICESDDGQVTMTFEPTATLS